MSGWGDSNAQNFGDWGSAATSTAVASAAPAAASWESKPSVPVVAVSSKGWNDAQSNDVAATTATTTAGGWTASSASSAGWGDNNASTATAVSSGGWGDNSAVASSNGGNSTNYAADNNATGADSRSARYYDNSSASLSGGYQRNEPSKSGGYQRAFEPNERPGRSPRSPSNYGYTSPVPYTSSSPGIAMGGGSDFAASGEERPRPRKIMGIDFDDFPSATTQLDPVGPPRERRTNSSSSSNGDYYSSSRRNDSMTRATEDSNISNSWESVPTPTTENAPTFQVASAGWGETTAKTAVEPVSSSSGEWGNAPADASASASVASFAGWGESAPVKKEERKSSAAFPASWTPVKEEPKTSPAAWAEPAPAKKIEAKKEAETSGWGSNTTIAGWGDASAASGWGDSAATVVVAPAAAISQVSAPVASSGWESSNSNGNKPQAAHSALHVSSPPFIPSVPVDSFNSPSVPITSSAPSNPYASVQLPSSSSWATCPFCHNCFVHPPVQVAPSER